MKSSVLFVPFVLLFASCAHVYKAPSNAKLEASTRRLSAAVTKASDSAQRAKEHVEAAQKAADKEATASASVLTQLNDLIKLLPPELQTRGQALKNAVDEDQLAIGDIITNVHAARSAHTDLEKDLAEARAADAQVKRDKAEYYRDADNLAVTATSLSSDLAWYRRKWWASWIVIGAGVIASIVWAVIKWVIPLIARYRP